MHSRKRSFSQSIAQPDHVFPAGFDAKRGRTASHVGHQHSSQRTMAPPLTPIDPTLHAYGALSTRPLALDQLLLTSSNPSQQQSFSYPKELLFPQDDQTPPLRISQLGTPSLNAQPDPWDPQGVNRGAGQSQLMNHSHTGARERTHSSRPQTSWPHTDASGLYSSVGRRQRYDSGYGTQTRGTRTVFSEEANSTYDTQSLAGGSNDIGLGRQSIVSFGDNYAVSSPTQSHATPADQHTAQSVDLKCEKCQIECKTPSEFNKHQLRHDKPFKCEVKSCDYIGAFTSSNDLRRHQQSKHQIFSGKFYMCAAPHCPKKTRTWPRTDNFRKHCQTLHKDLDLNVLMDRSCKFDSGANSSERAPGLGAFSLREDSGFEFPRSSLLYRDLQKTFNDNISTKVYPTSSEAPPQSMNVRADLTCNAVAPQRAMHSHGGSETPTVTLDPRIELLTATSDKLGSPRNMLAVLSSTSGDVETVHRSPERPTIDLEGSANNFNGLRSRVNSTSKPVPINLPDIAAKLALDIADRLGLSSGEEDRQTKAEVEKAIQNSFIKLLDSVIARPEGTERSVSVDVADPTMLFKCRYCVKRKKSQRDLTKHVKRHTRPYGCTSTSCPRRFGSKDDWKRHENTMHLKIEAWKCAEKRDKHSQDASSKSSNPAYNKARAQNKTKDQCGQVFYRREQFQAHLEDRDHGIKDPDYVRQQCKERRIGMNGQKGFWCGFCQTVIRLQKKELEAWDERFTHIDEEHFKKGEHVENWFPMDNELPKGILDEEKKTSDGEPEGSDEEDRSDDDVEEIESQKQRNPQSDKEKTTRSRSDDRRQPTKSHSKQQVWVCCQCDTGGPYSLQLYHRCLGESCQHKKCVACVVSFA